MNTRLLVGLSIVVGGFLTIYSAVALSFAAVFRDYAAPLFLLGIVLILIGIWVINPRGMWENDFE